MLDILLNAHVYDYASRYSSEYLTTGNMEFSRRGITSHYIVPLSGTHSTCGETYHHQRYIEYRMHIKT